jgi:uncharacterized delta-60 repeat protein
MKSVRLLAVLALLVAMTAIGSSASAEQISAGVLDTTFGGGDGKVISDIVTADSDEARAVAIQADGKIVVAGYSNGSGNFDFALARYTTSGVLDTTFGGGDGKVTTDIVTADADYAQAVAIQADGKIVVAGYSNGSGTNDFALARYTTAGVLDTTFGGGDGKLVTDIVTADQDFAYAVSIQADGKIVVAGTSNGSGTNDFALARYTTAGALDATFGTGGKVTTDIVTADNDIGSAMVIQADGKIIVSGRSNGSGSFDFALARYTTAGALDATFGTGGKVTTDIVTADTDIVNAMAIDADGKIVVFGETNGAGAGYDFALARYTTAGALDATFGTGGKVTTDMGADYGYAVAIQADGKIVVAGTSNGSGTNDFALARYTPAGVLDTTFSQDGKVLTDINTGTDDIRAIAIDADGKIVVAGTSDGSGTTDFALARYLAAGSGPLNPTETLYALSGDGQISVGWKAPKFVGSGIKTYVATAYPGGSSCTTTGSHACTITGLTNGTNYAISITASDTSGKSVVGIGTKPVAPSCEGPAAYGYTLTNTSNGARMEPPPVLLTPNC